MSLDQSAEPTAPSRNWSDDPGLSRVNAVVVILGCTLSGTTYRMQSQRLLDALNRSFLANLRRIGREFIPLTEVEAFFSTGEKEVLPSTHINKSSILFVAERAGGQPARSLVTEEEAKILKNKRSICSKVDIPPYLLYGRMHAETDQGLVHVIDGEDVFLPMTDVSISPPLPTGEWKFGFVAVNKHQIVRVEESSEIPKVPVLATPKKRRRKAPAILEPAAMAPGAADQGRREAVPDGHGEAL